MLEHFGVSEESWRAGALKDPDFAASETPCFVGRAIAALAADPQVDRKNGGVFSSWGLSEEYGFEDIDGRRPNWGAHFRAKVLDTALGRDFASSHEAYLRLFDSSIYK